MDQRVGDESAFAALVEGHRRELRVHCYRMVGSLDDAEDLTQETFLRAWRGRASFEGRSSVRAWLYRIATNACLDFLQRHARRSRPYQVPPAGGDDVSSRPPQVTWLQPYPDALLDPPASHEAEPDAAVVARETSRIAAR